MRLSGTETGLSGDLFSANWFMGVSVLEVPGNVARPLLENPAKRASALRKLAEAVPSELADASVEVGPTLDGDADDKDTQAWVAGFDSPGCCVGLYSAQQTKAPGDGAVSGMNRVHHTYYLVVKAGGGVAAQTFTRASVPHSRKASRSTTRLRPATSPARRRCGAWPWQRSATADAS